MSADEQTLQAIDGIGPTIWSGTGYRHTAPGRDPLSGEGARAFGGRWNPEDSPALYLADSVATCVAEFRRMAAGQGRGPASFQPRPLHRLQLSEVELLDLSSAQAMRAVGLTDDDIESDDRTRCQDVGEGALFLGFQGVRARSAASPDGLIIVTFTLRLRLGQVEHVETTELPDSAFL